MDDKFLDLFKYLDITKHKSASEKELKKSLQKLCDYFSLSQGRKRIRLTFDWYKLELIKKGKSDEIKSTVATSFLDYICLMPDDNLSDYQTYLQMIDSVIHESFHQFQYYLLNVPKEFVDDVMWQRILSYNIYYLACGKLSDYHYYRFCDIELDAYRATDFLLNKVCNKLKQKGGDVSHLKKYILQERKIFLNDVRAFKADLGENGKKIVDDWFKIEAIKDIKEAEMLKLSNRKIFEKMENGEYLYSIKNYNELVGISQEFLNNMTKNFKEFLPFLYGKTKPKFDNESFFEFSV